MVARPDLFQAAMEERLRARGPLAARMRPQSLDEMVGQEHLLGRGRPLRALIEADRLELGHAVGAARDRQDHARPAHRRRHEAGLRGPVGRVGRGEGRPRDGRRRHARCSASRGGGRSCSWTKCTGSTGPSRTPCCPSVEAGELTLIGATTENPFFCGERAAAFPQHAVPARAPVRAGGRGPVAQGARTGEGLGRRRRSRLPGRLSSRATPGRR